MIARVEKLWTDANISRSTRDSLVDTATAIMSSRASDFGDEHHPAFLHPLRTAILLMEADETDPRAHAVALVLDTEGRQPDADDIREAILRTGRAWGLDLDGEEVEVGALTTADPGERLELLVLAHSWLRNAWLAERLDQIRHLHLWAGPDRTRAALERAEREEHPLAGRVGGRLHRAWSDWLDKARRYRLAERAEKRAVSAPDGA